MKLMFGTWGYFFGPFGEGWGGGGGGPSLTITFGGTTLGASTTLTPPLTLSSAHVNLYTMAPGTVISTVLPSTMVPPSLRSHSAHPLSARLPVEVRTLVPTPIFTPR